MKGDSVEYFTFVIDHNIKDSDRGVWFRWIFSIMQRDVAVIYVKLAPYFAHIAEFMLI